MQLTTNRPFTRAEALASGLTVTQLAGPRYQRLFHDLYLPAQVRVGVLDRARAALKVSAPGTFASHHTAAALWGGCVPDTTETHISVPRGSTRSKRQGIRAHSAAANSVTVQHRGLLISSPLQTFLELAAAQLNLVDLVVLGDSLVKVKRTTPEELHEAAACRVAPEPPSLAVQPASYAKKSTHLGSRGYGC